MTGQIIFAAGGVAGTVTDVLLSGVGSPAGAAERGASPCEVPGGGASPSRFTDDGAGTFGPDGTINYAGKTLNVRFVSLDSKTEGYKSDHEDAKAFETSSMEKPLGIHANLCGSIPRASMCTSASRRFETTRSDSL